MPNTFPITDSFLEKALYYADKNMAHFLLLNGNGYEQGFPLELALGAKSVCSCQAGEAFNNLEAFQQKAEKKIYGYLGYDLKNECEVLNSINPDKLGFPDFFFFEPEHIIKFQEPHVIIESEEPEKLFSDINNTELPSATPSSPLAIHHQTVRSAYIENVKSIQQDIEEGEVYELNYCINFSAENAYINPVSTYLRLNSLSPTPFSCFLKTKGNYLLSASPERFLEKKGNKVISQPIKGTARRGATLEEDKQQREALLNNPKERAENLMIVDLVRNDLTPFAIAGTVKVDELFGIYTFPQVHQMISTVSAEIQPEATPIQVLKQAFPMGSMTGAPKVRAMELIDHYETHKRGLFSGAVGYLTPKGDFDFNVVIRSLLYNQTNQHLSFSVGSAITYTAEAEQEYEECLLKAEALVRCLEG